jgi:hypothetical protein
MLHRETISFSWESPEFEYAEKKKDWFWMIGIGAFVLVFLGIIMSNYLFSFMIILGTFLMMRMAHQEPLILTTEISEEGILYHNEMFKYEDVFNFWVSVNKKNEPQLRLLLNRRVSPRIAIPLDSSIDPMELREYLVSFIEEQEISESITRQIIEKIKF